MNKQQEDFCYYYCGNYNAAEAYRKAYNLDEKDSIRTAQNGACKLLKREDVKELVRQIRKDKIEALQIDADRVTEKLAEIAFSEKGDEYYRSIDQLKALSLLADCLGMKEKKVEVKQEVIKVGITD